MSFETYLNQTLPTISEAAQNALEQGAQDPALFTPFERATELMNLGYVAVETGYCLNEDGSAFVNVLTDMPDVTPAM